MTLNVYADFETRSLISVKDVGAYKYASHESTYPLMLAFGWKGHVHQWLEYEHGRNPPDKLIEFINNPDVVFHAFNAGFEIAVYNLICVKRWGWPEILVSRWRDTAARGVHANQPRNLKDLCQRLAVNERKDKNGKDLLNQLSVPQRTVKAKKYTKDKGGGIRKDSVSYLTENGVELFEVPGVVSGKGEPILHFWNNDPKLLKALARYNRQDIIAEQDADEHLPPMPESEQAVWQLDQHINNVGIPIDRELCEGVTNIFRVEADLCNTRIAEVAYEDDGRPDKKQVTKSTQRQRIVDWINERVNFGESLDSDTIDSWLEKPWGVKDEEQGQRVRDVLSLRQIAGGTGVKKYWAALAFLNDDDRVRGQLLYYGAATGRWAGKGIQPHNFVRLAIPDETFFDAIKTGNHTVVKSLAAMFGMSVMDLLKQCIRGMVRAKEGHHLVVSDFAGIEARVLQWLVGNEYALDAFRRREDIYVHAASGIFGIPYAEMMEPDPEHEGAMTCKYEYKSKRQIGKIATLALGYGQGAERYQGTCETYGVEVSSSFAQEIVDNWRATNPLIKDIWYRVERACKAVIKNKKVRASIDNKLLVYWDSRGYLCIRLPSGRSLYYYRARINSDKSIEYLDGGKQQTETYGAKIIENVVQAISRDLLVHSAHVAVASGLNPCFHIHDELVCEERVDNEEAYGKLHKAMETLPPWAEGLPLAAETHTGKRFSKW